MEKKSQLWVSQYKKETLNADEDGNTLAIYNGLEFGIDGSSAPTQFHLLKEYMSMKRHNMNILEIGSGNGKLCQLVLRDYGEYIKKYVIVESKGRILHIQQNYLSDFNNVEYVEISFF